MKLSSLMYSVFLAGLLFLAFTRDTHAYLDPGSGSYIIQLVVAGLLGGSLAIKIFWGNIKTFVSGLFSKKEEREEEQEEARSGKNDSE